MSPIINPTHLQGTIQMIMHSYVLFSITDKYLHIVTPDLWCPCHNGHLCSSTPCPNAIPDYALLPLISKTAHKVNLQFRAVNVISPTHPNALIEDVNWLFCIRQSIAPQATKHRDIIHHTEI